jgi:hypothetical protein
MLPVRLFKIKSVILSRKYIPARLCLKHFQGTTEGTTMVAESRYVSEIEKLIDTLRSQELNTEPGKHPRELSDFDQARLSSRLALLIHEGVMASATATTELTKGLDHATETTKRTLENSSEWLNQCSQGQYRNQLRKG